MLCSPFYIRAGQKSDPFIPSSQTAVRKLPLSHSSPNLIASRAQSSPPTNATAPRIRPGRQSTSRCHIKMPVMIADERTFLSFNVAFTSRNDKRMNTMQAAVKISNTTAHSNSISVIRVGASVAGSVYCKIQRFASCIVGRMDFCCERSYVRFLAHEHAQGHTSRRRQTSVVHFLRTFSRVTRSSLRPDME